MRKCHLFLGAGILSKVTQQSANIDLSTWTGRGIYFVHLIDGNGSTVDIKKIVLQ